jgi:hypothetical protein
MAVWRQTDEASTPMRTPATNSIQRVAVLVALVGLLALAAACTEHQSEPPTPSSSPASQPAQSPTTPTPAPKPTYTLIMTWMTGDQPPQTTQTVFHDLASCAQARDAAIAEGRRLALEALATPPATADKPAPVTRRYIGSALLPSDATASAPASAPAAVPKVAAICAAA